MIRALVGAIVLLLTACAPQLTPGSGGPRSVEEARAPKVLTIAVRDEPSDLGSFTATSSIRGTGNALIDRKSTRLNSSHNVPSRMPSSA